MPQTNASAARELARNSADCSFLLSHLIRQSDGRSDSDAKAILESILDITGAHGSPNLRASVTGWYGTSSSYVFNPATKNLDGTIKNMAVCFTESTLAGLKAHRDLFDVKYGIAFDRDLLYSKGANPCLNIREDMLREHVSFAGDSYGRHIYNFIPTSLQPFINVIHSSFDATHEREWRYPDNLPFTHEELFFVFCPEEEFATFSGIQTNAMPCLFDLKWLDRV
ncbi:hypothetical protein KO489_01375 [Reinekea forsetii]|nr:hypothetical protein [Reinekea forsetii]